MQNVAIPQVYESGHGGTRQRYVPCCNATCKASASMHDQALNDSRLAVAACGANLPKHATWDRPQPVGIHLTSSDTYHPHIRNMRGKQ